MIWSAQIELNMWITVIALFVPIITFLLLILVNLYKDIWNRPELIFTIGLGSINQNLPDKKIIKGIKKSPISGIVYGAQAPKKSLSVFFLPFTLFNNSKSPIKNISIIINMPGKHVLTDEEISTMIKDKLVGADENAFKNRIIRRIGLITQIEINIPILREREPRRLFDMIKFDNFYRPDPIDAGKFVTGGKFAERLMKIDKLNDFCIADITVHSENCSPISKQIKILWFDAGSEKELIKDVEESIDPAFWDGRFPSPRTYLHPWPMKPLFSYEYWDVKQSYLKIIHTKQDITYCLESYDVPSQNKIVEVKAPSWNYYQLPDETKK